MKVILLGAPGAGKGTQAIKLSRELNIPQISTGDIFRENIREGTPVGVRAKEFIDKGMLVPDEITLEIVVERLKKDDCANGYLLDGFPRTLPQAKALAELVEIDVALNIDIDQTILKERLCGRRCCPECGGTYHIKHLEGDACPECGAKLIIRKDDNVETVTKRLEVYNLQTAPLISYYEACGKLFNVDGNRDVEDVFKTCLDRLKE
jgi:adenylate kinase